MPWRRRACAQAPLPASNSRQGEGRHSEMPQAARVPTCPDNAAQRGAAWSVPRMRRRPAFTSTTSPAGTQPPSSCDSYTEKSTRKLAQQAPHVRQG